MWRPTTRQARNVPVRFVSRMPFHSASGISTVGVRLVRPAELTRICTPPNSLHAASSKVLMVASSVTSHGISSERLPMARISFAVASYLTDHVVPLLVGRDARRIEDIWQYLYKGAYWRRGPVTMCAIAAVDTALWDIKGKALNVPVYQLLGGASRESVLVYGHASGADIEDTVKAVAHYKSLGYKAIRAQSGIPGIASTYGVGKGKMYYEPAVKDAPQE